MAARDTVVTGDQQFSGVNELLPPGMLQSGEVASARNARFRFGKNEPRLGFFKVPWSNRVTSGASSVPVPYGRVYGRGYFQDPDSVVWCILAADGKVFKFRDGNGSSEVPLPPGVTITSTVSFTQTYNGLVLFRGIGLATLIMASLDTGFVVATAAANTISGAGTENPTNGANDVPQADRGEWIDARLFVPTETTTEKDLVNISDFLNATRFASVRSQARINQGSNDRLIRVLKFGKEHAAVCFKTASIYALYNTLGDLTEMSQDEITRQFGLLSPRACINIGKDEADMPDKVAFMGTTGHIYLITPDSGTGLLGVQALPFSNEMSKTVARINREVAASTVTFEMFNDCLYVAVPLDDGLAYGPELIRDSPSYDAGGVYEMGVIPGATYEWTKGGNDYNITTDNGTTIYSATARFTATGITAQLNGVEAVPVTASLRRVFENVNTAVMVYDFLRAKWCGIDDAQGMSVQEFIKLPIGGEEKLLFIAADGFINFAEALFDDEVAYESLGSIQGLSGVYSGLGYTTIATIVGRTYAYVSGAYESRAVNGTETIAGGVGIGTFVAQTTAVLVYGTTGQTIGFGVRLVDWEMEYTGIDHDWYSRGYRTDELPTQRKRFPWMALNVRTFNPSFSVTAIADGVNESFAVVTTRTKDNTRYLKPAGKADWDDTNTNDDHGEAFRQDYAVSLSDAVSNGADIVAGRLYYVDSADCFTAASVLYNAVTYNRGDTFTGVAGQTAWTVNSGSPVVYPPGSYILPGENGVVMDLHQETREEYRVSRRGVQMQFRVRNTQGRCETVTLETEAFAVDGARQKAKG